MSLAHIPRPSHHVGSAWCRGVRNHDWEPNRGLERQKTTIGLPIVVEGASRGFDLPDFWLHFTNDPLAAR